MEESQKRGEGDILLIINVEISCYWYTSEQEESDVRLKELEEKHKREMKTIQDEIAAWTEVSLKGKSPFIEERCLNKYPVRALSASYEVKS